MAEAPQTSAFGLTDVMKEPELSRRIRALAFDFDGTIADSIDYLVSAWTKIAGDLGIELDTDVESLIGLTGSEIVRRLSEGNPDLMKGILERRRQAFSAEQFVRNVKLFPEAVPTLVELKRRGYRLALASSTSSYRLQDIISGLGIEGHFDAIVAGDEVRRSKPAPDLILEAADRLEVSITEMAYVGDTRYDAEAASQAGAIVILLLRNGPKCSGPAPDAVIRDLSGLLDLVR